MSIVLGNIVLALATINLTYNANSIDHDAADDGRVRDFYSQCLCYDYCGVGGEPRADRGMMRHGSIGFNLRNRREDILGDMGFYGELWRFETNAIKGKREEGDCERLSQRLIARKQEIAKRDWWLYVSSIEYAVLRVLDANALALGTGDIEAILPDGLFERQDDADIGMKGPRHKAFRNMIVIARALCEWRGAHGSLPADLRELKLEGKWLEGVMGAKIEYSVMDGNWQLFSAGARGGKNGGKFNEYVPVMDCYGVRFWPQSSCLWLTADYSSKRKALYDDGYLYRTGESPCACVLKNGSVMPQRDEVR